MLKPYYENEHGKLYHGDCLEVMQDIEENSIDLVLTDPPYNAGKDYGTFKDTLSENAYEKWINNVANKCKELTINQAWIAPRYKMLMYLKIFPKSHIVVVRRGARGPFRGGWSDQFETILITGKPNKCEKDLWEDIRLKGEGYFFREDTFGHPGYTSQKIMDRCVYLIGHETVLDPFLGSGTTAVACVKLRRKFIGIEISEQYCEIAAKRIEAHSKQYSLFDEVK